MALPKIFKKAATAGALAAALFTITPAFTQSAQAAEPGFVQTSAYNQKEFADGLFKPIARAQGYDYLRLDAETKAIHPQVGTLDLMVHFSNRLIVYNFVDHSTPEHAKFSDMQSGVLEKTLAALAPKSTAKRIMLVEVDTTTYPVDYAVRYDDNTLGPNGTKRVDYLRPFGVVEGSGLKAGDTHLFDFALMNGVKTNADLNANAAAIVGRLDITVQAYNKQQAVALNSDHSPQLAQQ